MYTIKVNTFKNIDGGKKLKYSFYIEGECISITNIDRGDFERRKKEDKKIKLFEDLIADIVEKNKIEDPWHVNPSEEARAFVVLSYYDDSNTRSWALIYSRADIYILQNGKTIDKVMI